ncbi:receptor-like protein 53 [Apium graveolens]|uniref:receptor-like protein 53 n=1 Tax=Apium graveolens TaxID=4045 RepID=UPI003D7A0884
MKMFSCLESLEDLHLSHNSLSVRSTAISPLPPTLSTLELSSCNMKEFPHFPRDAEISLDSVDLSNNDIEGKIPRWIGSVGSYLNISHNRLTGGLEQLPWNNILYLDLQYNKLNGSLPTSICYSRSLEVLNLSHNNIRGILPICRTNLTDLDLSLFGLSVFDMRMNNIQGIIPATISNFRNLKTINLNGNRLEGTIPSSFAEFDSLQVLDIGNNQINDTFPRCLEALTNLQVLVLKSNKCYGLIDKSSKIKHPFPSLRIIDISYNEFSGPLPVIYFQSFKAMMNVGVNKKEAAYMEYKTDTAFYSDSTDLVIKGVNIEMVRIFIAVSGWRECIFHSSFEVPGSVNLTGLD